MTKKPTTNSRTLARNLHKILGQDDHMAVVALSNRIAEEAALLGGEYGRAAESFADEISSIAIRKYNNLRRADEVSK